MTLCSATTTDRLSGCLTQCILPKGHDDMHTDGGGLSWVDAPGSKYAAFVARMADGPPLEMGALAVGPTGQPSPYSAAVEATVDHLRARIRELEADLSALREEIATDPRHSHATEMIRRNERLKADLQEMRAAARAVVEATRMQPCDVCGRLALVVDRDGDPLCEAHAHLSRVDKQELPYAPAWRRLCALVEGK